MGQPNSQQETFSNVQPIGGEQFSNVTPIDASAPAVQSPPAAPFMRRVVDRISQSVAGLPDLPGKIAGDPKGTALGMVDSIASVSTPGLISRLMHHEDPANIVGDTSAALGTQMLGGEGPPPARGSVAAAMQPAESTGRLGRLVDVAKSEVHMPVLGRISKYWKAWKGPEPPAPPTPAPPLSSDAAGVPSGWQQPPPEVAKASGLMEGGRAPADPAAGLGKVPVRGSIAEKMTAPTNAEPSPIAATPAAQQSVAPPAPAAPTPSPRPIARGTLNKMMDQELGKALGAKQLDPKVPLRGQMAAKMPAESDAVLPEGHTAVDSSAVRSYGYKPAAREFEARATSGNTIYVYGDVPPEVATEFVDAPSKGKAWQKIRSYPLVAKIVDGKRIAVKPTLE